MKNCQRILLAMGIVANWICTDSAYSQTTVSDFPYFMSFEDAASIDDWPQEGGKLWQRRTYKVANYGVMVDGYQSATALMLPGVYRGSTEYDGFLFTGNISSPKFIFDNVLQAKMTLMYNMNSSSSSYNDGDFRIEIKSNNNDWVEVFARTGRKGSSDTWYPLEIDLTSFLINNSIIEDEIRVRFIVYQPRGDKTPDVALDFFEIKDVLYAVGIDHDEILGNGLVRSENQINVDGAQLEGQGLAWDGSTLYIKGDEIDGNGLNWNSSNGNMFVDGGSMDGHGIDWVSNDFVVDGAVLTGSGLSWDGTKFNVTTSSPWTSSAGLISYTSGKIGVGTNAVGDDYLMSIDGMVEAEEIVVQVVGVPDYVFHKDYNLSPLDELKNFIEKNSHLPEIPSAVELEETGMSLGEMNLLLLKKIEELTLHLIRQQAEIDSLKTTKK